MSAVKAGHDIGQLESDIRKMYAAMAAVGKQAAGVADADTNGADTNGADQNPELIRIIRQPGWTTPAEFLLVSGLVQSIIVASKTLSQMHQSLLTVSRVVGR